MNPITRREFLERASALAALPAQGAITAKTAIKPAAAANFTFKADFTAANLSRKPAASTIFAQERGTRTNENPAIIEGKDGVIVAAWSNKGVHHDNDMSNVIMASHSADGGKTWTEPVEAVPTSTINPTFIRAANGDVVLLFNLNRSTAQDDASIAFRRSSDNGQTWSETRQVDIGAPVAIIVQSGLVLGGGEWLISFQYDASGQTGQFDRTICDFVAAVAISADEGKTWRRYGHIEVPNLLHSPNVLNWAVEPAVYHIGKNGVGMILRTRNGRLYHSESADRGRTWSKAWPMIFSNDDSKPAAFTLANGHVVMIWNDSETIEFARRFPLMASLSSTAGKTWASTRTIEDDPVSIDYPALYEIGGSIKLVYAYDHQQIRYVDLKEDDLKAQWTCINQGELWSAADGLLQFAGGPTFERDLDYLKWSKACSFLPARPPAFSLAADIRIDQQIPSTGAAGVFFAYQDEGNWVGWIWNGKGRAGAQQESHWGSLNQPAYTRNISRTFFEACPQQTGRWFRLSVMARPGRISWQLHDRDARTKVAASENQLDFQGNFIALGAREVGVSFSNVTLRGIS